MLDGRESKFKIAGGINWEQERALLVGLLGILRSGNYGLRTLGPLGLSEVFGTLTDTPAASRIIVISRI